MILSVLDFFFAGWNVVKKSLTHNTLYIDSVEFPLFVSFIYSG